jgi:3-methyladenine DNA glycosylase Tag
MKINLSPTCGNSPKNKFVQDYTVKLLSFDFDNLANMSAENVKILIPDRGLIQGKANLIDIKKYLTNYPVLARNGKIA